jgi:hypothetical protein
VKFYRCSSITIDGLQFDIATAKWKSRIARQSSLSFYILRHSEGGQGKGGGRRAKEEKWLWRLEQGEGEAEEIERL